MNVMFAMVQELFISVDVEELNLVNAIAQEMS